ncbi:MAG TPA: hypothetical protein PLZ56_10395, partial [Anaerolineae bacterium]|nr:hypothetical protein [Anaerolineae bacterium]
MDLTGADRKVIHVHPQLLGDRIHREQQRMSGIADVIATQVPLAVASNAECVLAIVPALEHPTG